VLFVRVTPSLVFYVVFCISLPVLLEHMSSSFVFSAVRTCYSIFSFLCIVFCISLPVLLEHMSSSFVFSAVRTSMFSFLCSVLYIIVCPFIDNVCQSSN